MEINMKIPWGLATGTLGITIVGMFDGTTMLGMASITGGALALVTALLTKEQIEKKEIKTRTNVGTKVIINPNKQQNR